MGAKTKWPGGALQRAVRAGLDEHASAVIHADNPALRSQLQVARLVRGHHVRPSQAHVLAGIIFGEGRE